MEKLISVDFKADFGFFRKPDANNTVNLSYNMLHKPALLGILGAIIGLQGYEKLNEFPEYYLKLKNLKVGIEPLNHDQGNFLKTVIKYSNTVGYANKGTTFLTEEATLIKPAYRVYLLLDLENEIHKKLFNNLKQGKTVFVPYFGKNEHFAWWDEFEEYPFEMREAPSGNYQMKTIFLRESVVKGNTHDTSDEFDLFEVASAAMPYFFFEKSPIGFNEKLRQYELGEIVYTSVKLKSEYRLSNLVHLTSSNEFIQLI